MDQNLNEYFTVMDLIEQLEELPPAPDIKIEDNKIWYFNKFHVNGEPDNTWRLLEDTQK